MVGSAHSRLRSSFGQGRVLAALSEVRWQCSVTFPEDRTPSPFTQVFKLEVRPGAERQVEHLLAAAARASNANAFASYEALDGDAIPHYLTVVQRAGIRELTTLSALLRVGSSDVAQGGVEGIESIRSETWRYRPDLTYLPGS